MSLLRGLEACMGVFIGLAPSILNFLISSLVYFFINEYTFVILFDLKPQKELKFSPIMLTLHHFKLTLHQIKEIFAQRFISSLIISSMYIWTLMKSLPTSLLKRVVSTLPLIKPFSKRKKSILSYQVHGAYFRPYKTFLSLKTWSGRVWSSKPGGYLTYTSSLIKPFKKTLLTSIWKTLMFFMSNKGKHDSYGFKSCKQGFNEIYTFLLVIALSH